MPGGSQGGFAGALAHKDFRYLLASLTASGIGDWLYNVALVVYVFEATGSAAWVGAATIGRLLPYVFLAPIGGALADRFGPRRMMMAADLTQAALMLTLAVAAALSAPVVLAILLAFLATAAGTPFFPGVAATTPTVVDERNLAPANGLLTTVDSVSIALGPGLGGLLLLVAEPPLAIALNGLTFLSSAWFLGRISQPSRATQGHAEEPQPLHRQIADGVGAISSSPSVVMLVAILLAAALTYGQESVLYALVSEELLGTGSEGVGFLWAAIGIGGILGATQTSRVSGTSRPAVVLLVGSVVSALPLLVLPLLREPLAAYSVLVIEGAAFVFVDVVATTLLQRTVRQQLMARVFGILDSLGVSLTVVGALVAPLLAEAFGLRAALWFAGGLLVVLSVAFWPRLRHLDEETDPLRRELAPRVERLASLPVFAGLPRPSLEALAVGLKEERLTTGARVVSEGEPADDFFVVVSGDLEVRSRGESGGEERTVNRLGAGDYFGEIGLLERIPRTATVEAASDAVLFRIDGELFLDIVAQAPVASSALGAGVAGRLARTHPSHRVKSPHERTSDEPAGADRPQSGAG